MAATGTARRPISPVATRLFALPFLATGAGIVALGLGWIPIDPARVHSPGWVIVAAGLVFLCGGVAVLASTVGDGRHAARAPALGMVVALAAVFNWVAFGEGERRFTSTVTVNGSVVDARPVAESHGRLVFGAFAVVLDVALLAGVAGWWRRRTRLDA